MEIQRNVTSHFGGDRKYESGKREFQQRKWMKGEYQFLMTEKMRQQVGEEECMQSDEIL